MHNSVLPVDEFCAPPTDPAVQGAVKSAVRYTWPSKQNNHLRDSPSCGQHSFSNLGTNTVNPDDPTNVHSTATPVAQHVDSNPSCLDIPLSSHAPPPSAELRSASSPHHGAAHSLASPISADAHHFPAVVAQLPPVSSGGQQQAEQLQHFMMSSAPQHAPDCETDFSDNAFPNNTNQSAEHSTATSTATSITTSFRSSAMPPTFTQNLLPQPNQAALAAQQQPSSQQQQHWLRLQQLQQQMQKMQHQQQMRLEWEQQHGITGTALHAPLSCFDTTTTTTTTPIPIPIPMFSPSTLANRRQHTSEPTSAVVVPEKGMVHVYLGHIGKFAPKPMVVTKFAEPMRCFVVRLEKTLGIVVDSMRVIHVLKSPVVERYTAPFLKVAADQDRMIVVPDHAVVLVELINQTETVPSYSVPLRVGRPLKQPPSKRKRDASRTEAQLNEDKVRERLTALLNDRASHNISLDALANMTLFSKSALSLWRRDMYAGNSLQACEAVTKALDLLAQNGMQYEPSTHDETCTVQNSPQPPKSKQKPGETEQGAEGSDSDDETVILAL